MSRRKKRTRDGEVFGSMIRKLRGERGLTQEVLAERTELSVSYIGFIERDRGANADVDSIWS